MKLLLVPNTSERYDIPKSVPEWSIHSERLLFEGMMKTFRIFLLANLCAILPLLWAGLGWMPDQVKVYMRGFDESPGAIVADGSSLAGENYGKWAGGRIFRFYLPRNTDWHRLRFRFPGKAGAKDVERIELQKWKVVSFGKKEEDLAESGDGPGEYVFGNSRTGMPGVVAGKILWGIVCAELSLLAVSWIRARRNREEDWRTLCGPVACTAFALTLLIQVALPVQSYLANQSAYGFSSGELLGAVAVRFVWVGLLATVAFGLLARYFGRWVLSAALAWGICIYLESGILSADLPSLNGDWWFFYNTKRALWDFAVWAGVFATVLGAHGFLGKHQMAMALCLVGMVGASMLDIQREEQPDRSHLAVDKFVPIGSVVRNVSYSTNRNVLVFILDSLEREQARAILDDPEAGADLREKFNGFIEFPDNVGACPQTLTAVPNLLTGRYPDGSVGMPDYAWSCYSGDSALLAHLDAGHAAYMTTVGLGCGYMDEETSAEENEDEGEKTSALDRKGKDGGTWSVREISRWRALPFGAKASAASLVELGADASGELREWSTYPLLAKGKIREDATGVFVLIHTEGVHVPVRYNRHGEMLAGSQGGGDPYVEQGIFVMKELAALMDSYREKGIYDNSLILVLGDHGGHGEQRNLQDVGQNQLPRRARPALWVKPEGCNHGFATCRLPTSHANVSRLLKAAAVRRLDAEEIQELLQSNRRVFREMALWGNGWKDWVVDRDGSFSMEESSLGANSASTPRPVKCGRLYSLYWKDMEKTDADIFFTGMEARAFPVFPAGKDEVSLSLRVPDPAQTYTLKLRTGETGNGRLRFRCIESGQEWQEQEAGPYGMVVLHGVASDSNGMATIVFNRVAGPREELAFPSLSLELER